MRKKKLTRSQEELLETLKLHITTDKALPFDNLKNLCEFKSFDSSFNALLFKGHVQRHKSADYSNQFKLT